MNNKNQAIILAAGKGTRLYPLTNTRPKPFLKLSGRTILEHNLSQLKGLVDEVVFVVGYKEEQIKSFFGEKYGGINIKYISQGEPSGTGDAAKKTYSLLRDQFLLLNGDDIYDQKDIKECLNKFPCILLAQSENPANFGVVHTKENIVDCIKEKSTQIESSLVNTGLYFLSKNILDFQIEKSQRGEYEFTDYIAHFIQKEKLYWHEAKSWYPVSYPWNLLEANEFLLARSKVGKSGEMEKNCVVSGKTIVEEGALIKSGCYIEGDVFIGKNSVVGPNSYLRGPISIGENCKIGGSVEIKNSIIGDNSVIPHLNYVADSVIGENCNLAAGTITANFRFDRADIKVKTNGKEVDSKRDKLGVIMGDNAKTGINCSIMPGIIVGEGATIGPNSLVLENVPDKATFYNKAEIVKE